MISPTIATITKSISPIIVVLSPVFGGTGGFTKVSSLTLLFFLLTLMALPLLVLEQFV